MYKTKSVNQSMELKTNIAASRKRRLTRSTDEKMTKKIKIETKLISTENFDRRVDEILKKAIEIFFDLEDQISNKSTRAEYLKILKKVGVATDWTQNRIISTKISVQIFLQKDIITKKDCIKLGEALNEWIKQKFDKVDGQTKIQKAKIISNFYKVYISSLGVQHDAIESKINEISGTRRNSNTSTFSSSSTASSSSRYQSLDGDDNIASNACRLCGSTNSRLVINIYKDINNNTSFKHLIESYCWYVYSQIL